MVLKYKHKRKIQCVLDNIKVMLYESYALIKLCFLKLIRKLDIVVNLETSLF